MKIMILSYTDGINISGAFTSMIDLYFNLRRFIDVDFKIVFDLDAISIMRYFKSQNFFGDATCMNGLTKNHEFDSDIVIISCELLANLVHNKIKLKIGCDNLMIIDSLDLQRFNHSGFIPDVKTHISFNECNLLSNPSNFNILPYNEIEYYHKFSEERIKSLNLPKRTYNYRRIEKKHINLGGDIYFENIGKKIFENLICGNKVNYYSDGLTVEDGLCHYFNLFNVDPKVQHKPLDIKLIKIIDKLFFHKNDKLLEIL